MPNTNFDWSVVQPAVKTYLAFLQAHPNGNEIQYRTPLENLINSIKLPLQDTVAIQEDRHSDTEVNGMPDFFVYQDEQTFFKKLVGFIECKKPSYTLENLINSEQVKKYSQTTENIIITNYKEFILLQKGAQFGNKVVLSERPEVIREFLNLLQNFYNYTYPYIKTKKSLTVALASQSFYYSVAIREFVNNKENETDNFYTKFNALFKEYQKSINYHYELEDFCDIYSQSLVYGL